MAVIAVIAVLASFYRRRTLVSNSLISRRLLTLARPLYLVPCTLYLVPGGLHFCIFPYRLVGDDMT